MKKILAAALAVLAFAGPMPAYAQSVPQLGAIGQPIAPAIGAAGVAGAQVSASPLGASPTLQLSGSLTLAPGASVTRAAALAQPDRAGVRAEASAAAGSVAQGASAAAAGRVVGSVASEALASPAASVAARAGTVAQANTAGVLSATQARAEERRPQAAALFQLAESFDAHAPAAESSARSSAVFDALRRGAQGGAAAAALEPGEPAAQALPALQAGPALRALGRKVASTALGRLLPNAVVARLQEPADQPPAPAKPARSDDWGGPVSQKRTLWGQAAYGLKWALNLVGITTILSFTLGPLLALTPWPLYVPTWLLQATGRVELLIQFGPKAIAEALAASPLSFLFLQVPLAVGMEEFQYRLISFATAFLTLAAIRPVAGWISAKLASLPNLYGLVGRAQALLGKLGRVSIWSFPLAAVYSAAMFALAHVAQWGFDPFVLAVQAIAGFALVRTAYVSRGLVSPFVAHLAFTLLTLAGPALAAAGFIASGTVLSVVLGLVGIASLYYTWRVNRKLSKSPSVALAALLTLVLSVGAIGGFNGATTEKAMARLSTGRPVAVRPLQLAPQAPEGLPPELAQALQSMMQKAADPSDALPELAIPALVQQSKPAVVMVRIPNGSGSGLIVSKEGMLVTNAHVTESVGVGGQVIIVFSNGMSVPAKVLAQNEQMDLALVQLPKNPEGWPAVPLAPAGSLVEGQRVVTMGHPLGLPFTASDGIVSGLGLRGLGPIYRIQITAPISHGNSGGPLFDLKGRVVGVNSAGIEKGANLGFAIPVEEVRRAIEQFQKTGEIRSSYMGIILQAGEAAAEAPGVTIEYVRPGSPAQLAGLQAGDILAGADGQRFPPAASPALNALYTSLATRNPGEKMQLLVLRPQASGVATPSVITITVGAK